MDDVIFEEFKGTGNMEVHLDRKLSDKRVFPSIDINKSGTRKEELLITPPELNRVWVLRKVLQPLGVIDSMELLLEKINEADTNEKFPGLHEQLKLSALRSFSCTVPGFAARREKSARNGPGLDKARPLPI